MKHITLYVYIPFSHSHPSTSVRSSCVVHYFLLRYTGAIRVLLFSKSYYLIGVLFGEHQRTTTIDTLL